MATCIIALMLTCPVDAASRKQELKLDIAQASFVYSDLGYTQSMWNGHSKEFDPLARPIIPHWGAAYPLSTGEIIASAWLGHKMHTSDNKFVRKIWWLPQSLAIGAHAYALGSSVYKWRK